MPGRNVPKRADSRYVIRTPVQSNGSGQQRFDLNERGIAKLEELTREGLDIASIAKGLGVNRRTLLEMRKRQPEVEEAFIRGQAALGDEISSILMQHAREGNVVAAIFLAKARLGWRDQGPTDPNAQQVQVNITMPATLSDEAFRRMIDVTPITSHPALPEPEET